MGAGFGLLGCATRRPPAHGLGLCGHWLTHSTLAALSSYGQGDLLQVTPSCSKTANPFIQASQDFKHVPEGESPARAGAGTEVCARWQKPPRGVCS